MWCAAAQPGNADQIDNAGNKALQRAVVRASVLPAAMVHFYGNYFAPLHFDQRRQEAMHVIEKGEVHKNLAVEQFQAATGIRCIVFEKKLPNTVGNSRGNNAIKPVTPLFPVAGDHGNLCVLAQNFEQRRDVGRIILPVTIQRGDNFSAGMANARDDAGALTICILVSQYAQFSDASLLVGKDGCRVIATRIVNDDNLEWLCEWQADNFIDEPADIFRFVVNGNDD